MGNKPSKKPPGEKERKPPEKPTTGSHSSPQNALDNKISKMQRQGKKVVRAIYDYEAIQAGDLALKKGDVMVVINEEGDWWQATKITSNETGFIPATYVRVEKSLPSYDWYHEDIQRQGAESRLLILENSKGTFLVRKAGANADIMILSILDDEWDNSTNSQKWTVRHYRIRNTDAGGFYVTTKRIFTTVTSLVEHYQKNADGLCSRLVEPCPKPSPMLMELSRELKDKWEVPLSEVQLNFEIGKGNFGTVYKGLWKGCRWVAVKALRKVNSMSPQKFLEEVAVMKKLRHPKIVSLYAVCTERESIYIITELMSNGSLLEYLRGTKSKALTFGQVLDVGAQVTNGMRYIESKNLVHRDLRARNILVGDCNNVKIGDFGLAKISHGSNFAVRWTAPEAAIHGKFTIKSDVWAYGILLVELLTLGAKPYPDLSNSEVLEELQKGFRHPEPVGTPENLYERVLLACWHQDPAKRPTFEFLDSIMNDLVVSLEPIYMYMVA